MTASAQSARAEGGAGGVGRLTGGPKVDADDRVDLRGRDGGRLAGWRATRRRARGGFSQRRGVAPAGALTFCSPSSARPRASSSESVRMRSMVSKSAYSRDGAASQAGGQQGLGATAGARLKSNTCFEARHKIPCAHVCIIFASGGPHDGVGRVGLGLPVGFFPLFTPEFSQQKKKFSAEITMSTLPKWVI